MTAFHSISGDEQSSTDSQPNHPTNEYQTNEYQTKE